MTASKSFAARAAVCLGLAASLVAAQGDPLISKTLPQVFADQAGFWAFAADGLHYSRIDAGKDPAGIRNGALKFHGGIRAGVGRAASALLLYGYALDSAKVGGMAALDRDGKFPQDTIVFTRPAGQNKSITLGVEFSALALWRDTVVIGAGRGGIAVAKAKPEGQGALAGDSLIFRALPAGEDTGVAAIRCKLNAACPVSAIAEVNDKIGEPDSVAALAVDSSAADSIWLLIGSHAGLRRGLLGGKTFAPVSLPASKPGAIRIERIFAQPSRSLLWVFSGSEYFFSGDHGRTFHKPPKVSGVNTSPDSLTGFTAPAEALFAGDTTYVNLNLDDPGLVVFRRDTILANLGTGAFADVILDKADGLDIERGKGRLTTLAAIPGSSGATLLAGSTSRGLFLRRPGGAWANVNSLKALKNGLEEVITFPTLFSGTAADGTPEFVNLGYRLKKNGKVTITVYNYAMEKVKTLVKNAPRPGGGNRSEDSREDRWDGKDASGRHVSIGTYYILVESDQGEKGWGKAIAVHGRGP